RTLQGRIFQTAIHTAASRRLVFERGGAPGDGRPRRGNAELSRAQMEACEDGGVRACMEGAQELVGMIFGVRDLGSELGARASGLGRQENRLVMALRTRRARGRERLVD